MKIGIIGNQKYTKYLLNFFIEKKVNVKLIITSKKYNSISNYHNFKKDKKIKDIELYISKQYSLKNKIDYNKINNSDIDIFIVFGWARLIPKQLFKKNKIFLGMHGGMHKPPRCRGRAVFNWGLIYGHKTFYIYVMILNHKVDDGKIVNLKKIKLTQLDDIESLYIKYIYSGVRQLLTVINQIKNKKINEIKFDKKNPSYLPQRKPEDGNINWNLRYTDIINFVKAIKFPFPGAYTQYNKTKIIINECILFKSNITDSNKIGKIDEVFYNNKFTVFCRDGSILIKNWKSNKKFIPKKGILFKFNKSIKKINY